MLRGVAPMRAVSRSLFAPFVAALIASSCGGPSLDEVEFETMVTERCRETVLAFTSKPLGFDPLTPDHSQEQRQRAVAYFRDYGTALHRFVEEVKDLAADADVAADDVETMLGRIETAALLSQEASEQLLADDVKAASTAAANGLTQIMAAEEFASTIGLTGLTDCGAEATPADGVTRSD